MSNRQTIVIHKFPVARSSRYRETLAPNVYATYRVPSFISNEMIPGTWSLDGRRRFSTEKVSANWRKVTVKPGRGKFWETPTSCERDDRCETLFRERRKQKWHARYVNCPGAAFRLCEMRKHEWTVYTPQTFPPYRSMRMREISLSPWKPRPKSRRKGRQNYTLPLPSRVQ